MTIQSDSGRANSLTDWTREFSRGWNWDGIFLSFFSRQAKSLTFSFPGCSLCPIPVWIALLQLSLKRFRCLPLATSPIGQVTVQDPLWETGRRHTDKVTGATKLVLDNIGLNCNTSDTCLFQNTALCLSVLPLDVEDDTC